MAEREFASRYSTAFAAYLRHGSEDPLHTAYETGREALALGLSVVEVARLHHAALADAVEHAPPPERGRVVRAAGDFLAEALSAFEIVRRGYVEAREIAAAERRHAALLRRLSALLADTSLASEASESLLETLQLVAEGARELTGAEYSVATLDVPGGLPLVADSGARPAREKSILLAHLTALDGRELGSLRVVDTRPLAFTQLDEAILAHLAQMAAAAVERARLYD